jgi:hypothetical protein
MLPEELGRKRQQHQNSSRSNHSTPRTDTSFSPSTIEKTRNQLVDN